MAIHITVVGNRLLFVSFQIFIAKHKKKVVLSCLAVLRFTLPIRYACTVKRTQCQQYINMRLSRVILYLTCIQLNEQTQKKQR